MPSLFGKEGPDGSPRGQPRKTFRFLQDEPEEQELGPRGGVLQLILIP